MRVSILMTRKMDMEFTLMLQVMFTQEIILMILDKAMESYYGHVEVIIRASGKKIISMVKVN